MNTWVVRVFNNYAGLSFSEACSMGNNCRSVVITWRNQWRLAADLIKSVYRAFKLPWNAFPRPRGYRAPPFARSSAHPVQSH